MEDKTTDCRLTVDLTREEYIAFQQLMDKFAGLGRGRWGRAVIMVLFSLSLIALAMYELVHGGEMDWLTGITGLLLLVFSLLSPALEPVLLKRKAGRMYDESIAGGYSYYGTVRLLSAADAEPAVFRSAAAPESTGCPVEYGKTGRAVGADGMLHTGGAAKAAAGYAGTEFQPPSAPLRCAQRSDRVGVGLER